VGILVRVELLRQFTVKLGEIGGLHDCQSLDQHVMGGIHELEHQEYLFFHSCYVRESFLLNIGFHLQGRLLVNLLLHQS
jgi:hypothetical protein